MSETGGVFLFTEFLDVGPAEVWPETWSQRNRGHFGGRCASWRTNLGMKLRGRVGLVWEHEMRDKRDSDNRDYDDDLGDVLHAHILACEVGFIH